MLFRNGDQKKAVCKALVAQSGHQPVKDLFYCGVPTLMAYRCLAGKLQLESFAQIMVRIMFAFWDKNKVATITNVFILPEPKRSMVTELMLAVTTSHDEVDRWLETYRPKAHNQG